MLRFHVACATALGLLVAVAGCGGDGTAEPATRGASAGWPLPNADLASTRAVTGPIDASSVAGLTVRWRFRLPGGGESGAITANPVVAGETVFVQDMQSDVFALRRTDGAVRWKRLFHAGTPGPNGLSVVGARVYGSTDTTVFALDATTGRLRWRHRLLRPTESFVDVAPVVSGGRLYTATVGYTPGTIGAIYALSAETGRVLWRRSTIRGRFAHPAEAGGGGAWNPLSVDGGTLYVGTANPIPWGGTRSARTAAPTRARRRTPTRCWR